MPEWIPDWIAQNEFFQGGLVLTLMASLGAIMWKYGQTFVRWLVHRVGVTVEVDNTSPLFEVLSKWMDDAHILKSVRRFRYFSPVSGDFVATPTEGRHLLWLGKRPILLTRTMSEQMELRKHENFEIFIPLANQAKVNKLLTDVIGEVESRGARVPMLWHWKSTGWWWARVGTVPCRPKHTVSLRGTTMDKLVEDLKTFRASKQKYQTTGTPWRRGYLFHGPPGTGKSTTAMALSTESQMSVCYLSLSATGLDDSMLVSAVVECEKNSILLLEDIDAAMGSLSREDETEDGKAKKGVTLSGLLNVLDGIITPEGLVVIMTTNYPERLDAALVRPGRVDFSQEFAYADGEQAFEITQRLNPDPELAVLARELANQTPVPPALVQQAAQSATTLEEFREVLSSRSVNPENQNG